jgi:hypothetical protein
MNKKFKYNLIKMMVATIVIAAVFGIMFYNNKCEAESVGVPVKGIQISPAKITLDFKPGDEKTIVVNVKNYDKDVSHKVVTSIEDFYVTNESVKAQFFIPDNNHKLKAYDVIDWIEVEKEFVLEPNESKNVKIKIDVPSNTATGGYYGVIFFQTSEKESDNNNDKETPNINVSYRVGMLLINAVQGVEEIKIEGNVEKFEAIKKFFWKGPVEVVAKLHSSGNIHYEASGDIEIKKNGKKFAILKVEDSVMYPNRSRIITERKDISMLSGGIYTATLNMKSDDGSVIFKSETPMFFVIPWQVIVLIGGIVSGSKLMIFIFRRKFKIVKKKGKK